MTDTEAAYERLINLRFLKSLVAPNDFCSVIPSLDVQTEVQAEVIVLGNITSAAPVFQAGVAPDDPNAVQFQSGSQTGILTWHVLRGVASIDLSFLVTKGATSNPVNTQYTSQGTPYNYYLVFTEELFLSSAYQPKVAPDIATKFSLAKFHNGYINVVSSTRSGGTIDLAGLIHAGSWSDTRDGWQDSVNGAITPTALAQNSVTKKDGIVGEDIANGIFVIGASDVGTEFKPVNQNYISNPGNVLQVNLPTFEKPGNATAVIGAYDSTILLPGLTNIDTPGCGYCVGTTWISPWGVEPYHVSAAGLPYAGVGELNGLPPGVRAPYKPVQIPNTACYTRVAYDIKVLAVWTQGQGQLQQVVVLDVIDHFGHIQDNYKIQVTTVLTRYEGAFSNAAQYTPAPNHYRHSPNLKSQPGCTYLGTYFTLRMENRQNGPTTAENAMIAAAINAEYENFGGDGELGPVRIIRWTDVSVGQVITIKGKMRYGCISSGDLAPYVRSSATSDPTVSDVNWLPVASMLFNSDAPDFKRCYGGEEYLHLVDNILPNLTIASLRGDDRIPKQVSSAMESAGFFDTIGKGLLGAGMGALQGAIGGITQGPAGMMKGAMLGGLGGGISGLTSAGMYQPASAGMYSAGMYQPASAGMYPGSTGMYGGQLLPAHNSYQPSGNPTQNQPLALGPAYVADKIQQASNLLQSAGMYGTQIQPSSTGRFKRHRYQ